MSTAVYYDKSYVNVVSLKILYCAHVSCDDVR